MDLRRESSADSNSGTLWSPRSAVLVLGFAFKRSAASLSRLATALAEHERLVARLQDELRDWRTRVSKHQSDTGVESGRAEAAEARAAKAEAAVAAAEQSHAQLMTALEAKRHEAAAAQHAHLQVRNTESFFTNIIYF